MAGTAYAQVHLRWTIPPALILWRLFRRVRTQREVYKTWALICIAIAATIPWDSYLIRHNIWSYPESSTLGFTLFSIPLEEVFFFFIQTYITSCLYALIMRPVIGALQLPRTPKLAQQAVQRRATGSAVLLATAAYCAAQIPKGGPWTYMCLIIAWCAPFFAIIWGVAASHIIALRKPAMIAVVIPTVYLWICDSCALRRGTWVIERGTKLGFAAWGLEIEEAVFFFLTNALVVCGLIACDYCFAIYDVMLPSPDAHSLSRLLSTVVADPRTLPFTRLNDLRNATDVLKAKSKSFYAGCVLFEGQLQLDLLSLYAFCRVVDDLVDEPPSGTTAATNLSLISSALDLIYTSKGSREASRVALDKLLASSLPSSQRSAFHLLTTLPISRAPLDELLEGFQTDVRMTEHASTNPDEPFFASGAELFTYAEHVASSVADACCQLSWYHYPTMTSPSDRKTTLAAARRMGRALQLTNIARDVPADVALGRCYLPTVSLTSLRSDGGLTRTTIERQRLVALARKESAESRPAISALPAETRGGLRAACDVYMDIGEAVEERLARGQVDGRAKVGQWRRARVAWRALGS